MDMEVLACFRPCFQRQRDRLLLQKKLLHWRLLLKFRAEGEMRENISSFETKFEAGRYAKIRSF